MKILCLVSITLLISNNVVNGDFFDSVKDFGQKVHNLGSDVIHDIKKRIDKPQTKTAPKTTKKTTQKPTITPNVNKYEVQLHTLCSKTSYPMMKAFMLTENVAFKANKTVVILGPCWTCEKDNDGIDVISKAYNCRNDVNFVVVRVVNYGNKDFNWSDSHTEEMGQNIAKGLVQLHKIVLSKDMHLIGHSVSAHVMALASRYYNHITGEKIQRLTGLDPAAHSGKEQLTGLRHGDAEFVDVIHTSPGTFGIRDQIGDADFYPNGFDSLPPGCKTDACAHERAYHYYAESVYPGNENNFMAQLCLSLSNFRENKCTGVKSPMGYSAPHNINGSFFLNVNKEEPYGKNRKVKTKSSSGQCGVCKR